MNVFPPLLCIALLFLSGSASHAQDKKVPSNRITFELPKGTVMVNSDRARFEARPDENVAFLEGRIRIETKQGDLGLGNQAEIVTRNGQTVVTIIGLQAGSAVTALPGTFLVFTIVVNEKAWSIRSTQLVFKGARLSFSGSVSARNDRGDCIRAEHLEISLMPGDEKMRFPL